MLGQSPVVSGQVELLQVESIHEDPALTGVVEPHEETGECALASPGVSHHGGDLAWAEAEAELLDDRMAGTGWVGEGDVSELNTGEILERSIRVVPHLPERDDGWRGPLLRRGLRSFRSSTRSTWGSWLMRSR